MSDVITRKVQTTANTEKHGKLQSEQIYTLDFSDVTRDELIEFARKSLTIELQDKARRAAKAEGRNGLQRYDAVELSVRDYLDGKTQRKSKSQKLAETLGVTVEEAEFILSNPEAVAAAMQASQE